VLTVSRDRPLLTTITGSLPRPGWFTVNLGGRPFSLAMTGWRSGEQYTGRGDRLPSRPRRGPGLDLLTDGDARCDADVGGRSWFGYAGERLGGVEGFKVMRGATASSRDKAPGDLMFEVLETRVLPRVTGRLARGPLEYTPIWAHGPAPHPPAREVRRHRRPDAGRGAAQRALPGPAPDGHGHGRGDERRVPGAGRRRLPSSSRWRNPPSTGRWASSTTASSPGTSSSRPSIARSEACASGPRSGATPAGATPPPSARRP